jgi:ABC-type branched-subunit amino acid transport system substrate-binding protein
MEAVRASKVDGLTGPIAFDSRGDREKADYWVVRFNEAKYPGTAVTSVTASPPAASETK